MERVGQSLLAIDWHSFPGWSKGKLQNPPDKSLSIVRFVCTKPLDFVKLGLSSLATEHLTLRRSGGEEGGDWGGHSLSLQELWRETLETRLPPQQLVPSFFCHRWRAQKQTSEEGRLSGKQQHTILHFVLSLDRKTRYLAGIHSGITGYGWLSYDQSNTHFFGSLPSLLYSNTTVKAVTSCNLPVITSGS